MFGHATNYTGNCPVNAAITAVARDNATPSQRALFWRIYWRGNGFDVFTFALAGHITR